MLAKNRNRVSCQEIVKFSERSRALICCECEFMQSPLRGNRSALKLAARSAASASLCNRRFAAIALRSNLLLARLPPCHCAPCSIVLPKKNTRFLQIKAQALKSLRAHHTTPLHRGQKRTSSSFLVVRQLRPTTRFAQSMQLHVSARDKRAVCLYSQTYVASFCLPQGHRLLNLAFNSSTVEK